MQKKLTFTFGHYLKVVQQQQQQQQQLSPFYDLLASPQVKSDSKNQFRDGEQTTLLVEFLGRALYVHTMQLLPQDLIESDFRACISERN